MRKLPQRGFVWGGTHPPFEIPADIRSAWDMREKGARAEQEWRASFAAYKSEFPALAAELERRMAGDLPSGLDELVAACIKHAQAEGKSLATRQSSQATLNALGPSLPELLGGSADLTPSNGTLRKDSTTLNAETPAGNYVHFGVREFGMSAILNGLTAHGGFIPYGGTFLTFSDYARNAVRMAALMRLRVIFVYTHDSIGLGEDGPTHQPIEHLASLRVIPQMDVWRPCDAVETATAWGTAIDNRDGPTCLVLTRQAVVHQARDADQLASIRRGGYVLIDSEGPPEAIVIATGSEVGIAAEAVRTAAAKGRKVRLVSMPSSTTFDRQDDAYKESVLPAVGHAPRGGGGRRARAVVALCRPQGTNRRHRSFRRIGARKGVIQAVWIHAGACGAGDRQGVRELDSSHKGQDDGNQSRDQRLWAHRPQHSARPVRGQTRRRHQDRRDQRSGRRQYQCPPDALRYRARPFPRRRAGRWRCDDRERRPHQSGRAARPVEVAVARARRGFGARVHGPLHQQGQSLRASDGRREKGLDFGSRRRRCRCHRRLRRQSPESQRRPTR